MFRSSAGFGTTLEKRLRGAIPFGALTALLSIGSAAIAQSGPDPSDDPCAGSGLKLNYSVLPVESDLQSDELTEFTIANNTGRKCTVQLIILDGTGEIRASAEAELRPNTTFRFCTRDPNFGPEDPIIRSLSEHEEPGFGCSAVTFDLIDGLFAGSARICTQSRCISEDLDDPSSRGLQLDASNVTMRTVEYGDGTSGRKKEAEKQCTVNVGQVGNKG